jgi:predicted O-methyltransferase YrrM
MVLGAARQLFGRDSTGRWQDALAELTDERLRPPAIPLQAGITHRVTLGRWLYAAVRVLRPELVIETGVASGASSWLILNALARNEIGTLHSIDLPNRDPARAYNVGAADSIGRAVPDCLRSRWRLSIGDSRVLLPELLAETGPVGLFFHDSEHSLQAMTQEFEAVLPSLEPGGLIVSDDVQKNAAFSTTVRRHSLRSYTFRKGGTARKVA